MPTLNFSRIGEISAAYGAAVSDAQALMNYYAVNNTQPTYAQQTAVVGQYASLVSAFAATSQSLVNISTSAGIGTLGLGLSASIASMGANLTQLMDAIAYNNFDAAVGSSFGLLASVAGFASSFNAIGTLALGADAALLFPGALPIAIAATAAQLVWQNRDSFAWAGNELLQALEDASHEATFMGDLARSVVAISKFLLANPDPTIKDIKYLPWVDPLVLDLDGDGLEITPLSAGVQFDTNADTIRTATAWVGADDGLVVLDRNGNGQIDSARELFGDETLLEGGTRAAHGFAALAELDVGGAAGGAGGAGGAGDGIFDAQDAQFGAVRVWRDLNQDGISQAGELQSMAEAGIASIALASTATETSYGDAQLVQSGSFARADGSEGQAGSFILAVDHAVATHPPIPVSAEAAALPQVQGSGWVRGLQDAATLSPQLLGLYEQASQAGQTGTRAQYGGCIGELLLEWGCHSDYMSASKVALAEDDVGLILRNPDGEQELAWMEMTIKAEREVREAFRAMPGCNKRRHNAIKKRAASACWISIGGQKF